LRKRFPTAHELVYDNYNFFVIGYCAGERPSDCMFSLVADRKGMALSFYYYGSSLPDPRGILAGRPQSNPVHSPGRRADAGDLARPVIRSVSGKQRPRR
jgi:hypothetical protein